MWSQQSEPNIEPYLSQITKLVKRNQCRCELWRRRDGFVNIILVLLILKDYEETLMRFRAQFTMEMSRTGPMWMLMFQNGAKHLAHQYEFGGRGDWISSKSEFCVGVDASISEEPYDLN